MVRVQVHVLLPHGPVQLLLPSLVLTFVVDDEFTTLSPEYPVVVVVVVEVLLEPLFWG